MNSTPAITRMTTPVPMPAYDMGLTVSTDAFFTALLSLGLESDSSSGSGPKSGGGVRFGLINTYPVIRLDASKVEINQFYGRYLFCLDRLMDIVNSRFREVKLLVVIIRSYNSRLHKP